jgi:hypothetical protein
MRTSVSYSTIAAKRLRTVLNDILVSALVKTFIPLGINFLLLDRQPGIGEDVRLELASGDAIVEEEVELFEGVTLHLGKNKVCPADGEE